MTLSNVRITQRQWQMNEIWVRSISDMTMTGKNLRTRRKPCPSATLWNAKIHYHLHKRPSLVPVLSQVTPVHTLPTCFFETHLNTILPSTPRSSKSLFPSSFPKKKTACSSVPHVQHLTLYSDHPHNTYLQVQIFKLPIMQFSQASCYFLYIYPYALWKKIHAISTGVSHTCIKRWLEVYLH
jgi:hypothetical protein